MSVSTYFIGIFVIIIIIFFIKVITEKELESKYKKQKLYKNFAKEAEEKLKKHRYENTKKRNNDIKMNNTMNKKENQEEVYISTNDIAKRFKQPRQKIYEIFYLLKWIEKKDECVIATPAGERNGAKQLYSNKSKQKFVMWDMKILENKEFRNIIESIKIQEQKEMTKKEKGDFYEAYVAEYFRNFGHYVWEHGKEKGKEDGGIDLVVKINKFVYFAQCKNWEKWKVDYDTVLATEKKIENLIKKHEGIRLLAENYPHKILYITPGRDLNKGEYRYIKENSDIIEHQIIPIV